MEILKTQSRITLRRNEIGNELFPNLYEDTLESLGFTHDQIKDSEQVTFHIARAEVE